MIGIKKLLLVAVLASTALSAGAAMAATQGTLGATSTGTAVVTLTVPSLVEISGLTDLALGSYSGTGVLAGNEDVCVYSNVTGTAYHVTATTDKGSFVVKDGGGTNSIPMDVRWNNAITTTGNASLVYSTKTAATGANPASTDCSTGGKSANLQVSLAQADLQAAPATAYSSTISLLIEP